MGDHVGHTLALERRGDAPEIFGVRHEPTEEEEALGGRPRVNEPPVHRVGQRVVQQDAAAGPAEGTGGRLVRDDRGIADPPGNAVGGA